MPIPRVLVPRDARISVAPSSDAEHVRQDLLVPRSLIPANAGIIKPLETSPSPGAAGDSRRLMVPKMLVPTGARIGAAVHPSVTGREDVFDEAMLGDSALGRRRGPADWLISLGVHAALVAVVLIIPLFYTQVIDLSQFNETYLAAPPALGAPPPPPLAAGAIVRQPVHKTAPITAKLTLTMPTAVPKRVAVVADAAEVPPDLVAGVPGGVPGGVAGGEIGGVLGGILGGGGPSVPPPPVAATAPAAGPLHVGGEVKRPQVISDPQPQYPRLALESRIQGSVRIDAVIDKSGNVVQAHAVDGPPMLMAAALDAVKQWRYQPTYLNGVPWPVELTINVDFHLS